MTHAMLTVACLVVLAPVALIAVNSLKSRQSIFSRPFDLPIGNAFDLSGYQLVLAQAHFPLYFLNSTIVTLGSTLLVLGLGAMAAHGPAEYRFRFNRLLFLYFALGIMISIRLGSVGIVRLLKRKPGSRFDQFVYAPPRQLDHKFRSRRQHSENAPANSQSGGSESFAFLLDLGAVQELTAVRTEAVGGCCAGPQRIVVI